MRVAASGDENVALVGNGMRRPLAFRRAVRKISDGDDLWVDGGDGFEERFELDMGVFECGDGRF